jgi:hypothetical protein
MPDLDLLPPGHGMRTAPHPPAGLGDVLTRATRRRRRQAGALATGVAAACAALLAVTMTAGGGVDSLGVTPAHPGLGVVPSNAPQVAGADAPSSVADAPAGSAPQSNARGSITQQPAAAQERQREAVAAAGGQQPMAGGEVGPAHTTTTYDPSRGCAGDAPVTPAGWCGYYDGATTGRAGQPVELAETVCRLAGQGDGDLRTDNGQQAEFSATSQDAYLKWEWSKGHRFSKAGTTFHVAAGTCLRWKVSWRVVDNAGRPLAPGAYSLDARSTAYPPSAAFTRSNAIAFVTFTVT